MDDVLAILDDKTDMSAGFTTVASPVLSAKSYDTGAVETPGAVSLGGAIGAPLLHDYGRGRKLTVKVQITTTVTSVGAATLKVEAVQADNGPLTTNKEVLEASAAIAKATLVAGYRFRSPRVVAPMSRRFYGLQYTVGTADLTAGAVYAAIGSTESSHQDTWG